MTDILTQIANDKLEELKALKAQLPLSQIESAVNQQSNAFQAALSDKSRINIIAEIKKASPSKGVLSENFDVARIAKIYQAGGAVALSVLTETKYFLGDPTYLRIAHEASGLPVLCKDFMIDEYQFYHARYMGAHAVLLIARMYDSATLEHYVSLVKQLGLDSLVEVHNEQELEQALKADAAIIGVNNRDLATFTVDLGLSERLAKLFPDSVIRVVESGIHTSEDVKRMQQSGYNCFLIGEALMKSTNPATLLMELRGV
jgi:indole-3-glycerol phosphate synthase